MRFLWEGVLIRFHWELFYPTAEPFLCNYFLEPLGRLMVAQGEALRVLGKSSASFFPGIE